MYPPQPYGQYQPPYGQYQPPYGYPPQPPPPKRKTNLALAFLVVVGTMAGGVFLLIYVGEGPGRAFDIDHADAYPGEYTFGVLLRAIVIFPMWVLGPLMLIRTVGMAWVLCVWNAVAAGLLLFDPVFFAEGQFAAYFHALDLGPHNVKLWMIGGTALTAMAALCAFIAALTPRPAQSPPGPPGYPPLQQHGYPPHGPPGYPPPQQHGYPPPQPPRQW